MTPRTTGLQAFTLSEAAVRWRVSEEIADGLHPRLYRLRVLEASRARTLARNPERA